MENIWSSAHDDLLAVADSLCVGNIIFGHDGNDDFTVARVMTFQAAMKTTS